MWGLLTLPPDATSDEAVGVATVTAYWRPESLGQALLLLEHPRSVVLAGGTRLNGLSGAEHVEVVDLQALHLDGVERQGGDCLLLGAMTTLAQVVSSGEVPQALRDAARRELPSTLRAQATIGGCVVVGDPESELLATMLVFDATVRVMGPEGLQELTLEALLADLPLEAGKIATAVIIDTRGVASAARTARTRADKPIVAAVARAVGGEQKLALSGVATRPVMVTRLDDLDPPGDFRGSSEYRRALATTLASRALKAISL